MFGNEPLEGSLKVDLSSKAAKAGVVLPPRSSKILTFTHLQYLLRSLSAMPLQLKVFTSDGPDVANKAPETAVIVDTR